MHVIITDLDRKLFKNIPPECPPAPEGQETFHSYMEKEISSFKNLLEALGTGAADVVDVCLYEYEKSGLPEKEGIFRFPTPKDTVLWANEEQYATLKEDFYQNVYFKAMDSRWKIANGEYGDWSILLPGIAKPLQTMVAEEEAVKKSVGGALLAALGSLGLALLCALGAFGAHWLIGASASWSRNVAFPFSLVLGAIPLLSWAGLLAGGVFAVVYLLRFFRQMGEFFGTVATSGERKRRRKAFWQAYRDALRYVRLRQLFYQHLTGKENHTFREIQRTVQKLAAPYIHQFKW